MHVPLDFCAPVPLLPLYTKGVIASGEGVKLIYLLRCSPVPLPRRGTTYGNRYPYGNGNRR